MAYSTTMRDALQEAFASGKLAVSYGDTRVQYRTIEELERALNRVERALSKAAGDTPLRQVRVKTDRGY